MLVKQFPWHIEDCTSCTNGIYFKNTKRVQYSEITIYNIYKYVNVYKHTVHTTSYDLEWQSV